MFGKKFDPLDALIALWFLAGIGLILSIASLAHAADLPTYKPPVAHPRAHVIPRSIPKLPPGLTCQMVRDAVEHMGSQELDYYKLMLKPRELDAAQRCLKEKAV